MLSRDIRHAFGAYLSSILLPLTYISTFPPTVGLSAGVSGSLLLSAMSNDFETDDNYGFSLKMEPGFEYEFDEPVGGVHSLRLARLCKLS